MIQLLKLREYSESDISNDVYINPSEVASIKTWKYHSYRPSISEIILNNGEKIHVWDDIYHIVNEVTRLTKEPNNECFSN